MLKISDKTNLLEQSSPIAEGNGAPNYFREIFSYREVPKVPFDGHSQATAMPGDIWMTDTTFRDGQQSVEPYSVKQIVDIFTLLSRLSGEQGRVRQTEFFVYGKKNIEAIERCRALGFRFPEITTWIRADKKDLEPVKRLGIAETGILTSVSDYQIYKKLGLNRERAMAKYEAVVGQAMEYGIVPRCHLEDVTRADFEGFVLPFVERMERLSQKTGVSVKYRICDTLGFGVPYQGASLPRSVIGIATALRSCGVHSERMEWHGHNDFYKAVANASTAWLYGISAVNCSLFGRGERTGNIPLEGMAMEYASLKGDLGGMNTAVITEIADYYKREIGYDIPQNTPFVGEHFNMTRAGIHADGLMKDEELYNIFDTGTLLNKPPQVQIGANSGAAGIAYYINTRYGLSGERCVQKSDALVIALKDWVAEQFASGRQTLMTDSELEEKISLLTGVKKGEER
ncbi:MAG: 2-isopropylmalate synthase [Clostridia bacterium]|nr:2-isopropylmalate synthase [Clostridia bacterium]